MYPRGARKPGLASSILQLRRGQPGIAASIRDRIPRIV
jgi:hypothetical protein